MRFHRVWVVDTEFQHELGHHPNPRCLVAKDVSNGNLVRVWADNVPPTPFYGKDDLLITFSATAEAAVFLVFGWPLPTNVLDLYVEARLLQNGNRQCGDSLLDVCKAFNIPTIDTLAKEAGRTLAMRAGHAREFTPEERRALLDYCQSDVEITSALFKEMERHWFHAWTDQQWSQAMIRGQYMAVLAQVERSSLPIDVRLFTTLRTHWRDIQRHIVSEAQAVYGCFDGLVFKKKQFADWLHHRNIPWPTTPAGAPRTDEETFKTYERMYPEVELLRQVLNAKNKFKDQKTVIGPDGRNRVWLRPFITKTGRNAPSNSEFILGSAAWLRRFIQPPPGRALAYLDYSQQEIALAAYLSGDTKLQEAYESGDVYIASAIQAGELSPGSVKCDATKAARGRWKSIILATQYEMGAHSLAARLGCSVVEAQRILDRHRRTYADYWAWHDGVVEAACEVEAEPLVTKLGWTYWPTELNQRTIGNWYMQAHGSDLLRLSCIHAIQNGINVVAPLHDAVFIEADENEIDEHVIAMRAIMSECSKLLLDGHEIRTDAEIIRHPDHFEDDRGKDIWLRIDAFLKERNIK